MVLKTDPESKEVRQRVTGKVFSNPSIRVRKTTELYDDTSQCSNGYYDCMQEDESFCMADKERRDYFKRYILFNSLCEKKS